MSSKVFLLADHFVIRELANLMVWSVGLHGRSPFRLTQGEPRVRKCRLGLVRQCHLHCLLISARTMSRQSHQAASLAIDLRIPPFLYAPGCRGGSTNPRTVFHAL